MRMRAGCGMLLGAALATAAAAGDWEPPRIAAENAEMNVATDLRAASDGTWVLAWTEGWHIRLRRLDRDLEPLAPPVSLFQGMQPILCPDGDGQVAVVLQGLDGVLQYALVTEGGEVLVDPFEIDPYDGGVVSVDVARGGDGLVRILLTARGELRYIAIDPSGTVVTARGLDLPADPHDLDSGRIFPLADGTSTIVYLDQLDNPSVFSRAYRLRIDAGGALLEGPDVVSHDEIRTYVELSAARDSTGRIHMALRELTRELPPELQISRIHYRILDEEGRPLGPIRPILREEYPHIEHFGIQIALDDLDRPHLFARHATRDRFRAAGDIVALHRIRVLSYPIDPAVPSIRADSAESVAVVHFESWPRLRPDGRGGWAGVYGGFSEDLVWHVWTVRTDPSMLCRNGNAGGGEAFDRRTLLVGGSGGDARHRVGVAAGEAVPLLILDDAALPTTRFYVQARAGRPASPGPRWFPKTGLACFDFLDHEAADAVWNGLGGLDGGALGSSRVRTTPIPDPPPHPGLFYTIPGRATAGLPPGTRVTFQGLQSDPASRTGFAVTNAVILEIL